MQKLADGANLLEPGEAVPDHLAQARRVHLTKAEFQGATNDLKWGYDDPGGKFKADDPIGVKEWLRRRSGEVRIDDAANA